MKRFIVLALIVVLVVTAAAIPVSEVISQISKFEKLQIKYNGYETILKDLERWLEDKEGDGSYPYTTSLVYYSNSSITDVISNEILDEVYLDLHKIFKLKQQECQIEMDALEIE